MKRIQIFVDDWHPHISGVVRTLDTLRHYLKIKGYIVDIVHPYLFEHFSCPGYKDIKIIKKPSLVGQRIKSFSPNYIHIHTPEGSVGYGARKHCDENSIPYTTGYPTKTPEYIRDRFPIPLWLSYKYMRRCHKNSKRIMVPSNSFKDDLENKGFSNLVVWGRGVDTGRFHPEYRMEKTSLIRPIFLYVGRVDISKNIESFLKISLRGQKIVVGDGPQAMRLVRKYPNVRFTGTLRGKELSELYATADVLVFPSKTDTFGLVILEAIASGTPVAAYNVTGPKDIIENGVNGYIGDSLKENILKCLQLKRDDVYYSSKKWDWDLSSKDFISHLEKINGKLTR